MNKARLEETSQHVMRLSNNDRKGALENMLNECSVFVFDGRPVCAEFLVKAFRFSRDLQCAVKRTQGAEVSRQGTVKQKRANVSVTKDSIAVFLRRIADQTGNAMPDTRDIHLPFYDKKEVYNLFCTQYSAMEKKSPPQSSYFYNIWSQSLPHIKIRRVTRFTLCGECESYKQALRTAAKTGTRLAQIQEDRDRHVQLVATERQAYKMNQDNAKLNPSEYMSLVIDGADQSAFGLPHFSQ